MLILELCIPCYSSPGTPHSTTSMFQKVMGFSTPQCSCWQGTTMTVWYRSTPSSTSPPSSTLLDGAPSRQTLCLFLWTQSLDTEPESPPVRSFRRWPTLMHSSPTVSKFPGSNRSTKTLGLFSSFYLNSIWSTLQYITAFHPFYNLKSTFSGGQCTLLLFSHFVFFCNAHKQYSKPACWSVLYSQNGRIYYHQCVISQ